MEVATDIFFCDIHPSVTDYWKREKNNRAGLGSVHQMLIGVWNVDVLIKKFLGPAYVTREMSAILPEDRAFW